MSRIALIHTVPTVYLTFADTLSEVLPTAMITNTLDDYLASNAETLGYFSKENYSRLYNIIDTAAKTHPDLIAVTCSTLSPYVVEFRKMFEIPLVTIDELMISEAVKSGSSILIVSTAESTVIPTKTRLLAEAERQKKSITIDNTVCNEAYVAIKEQNKSLHDTLVLKQIGSLARAYDVVVLAQASMAHLEEKVQAICDGIVVSSPRFCIENIQNVLNSSR